MAVKHSLETASSDYDDDGHIARTGTVWNVVAHIITAVIGSGVLSLAWSNAQLGWIAGPACLVFLAVMTYVSSSLLSDCYRSPDSVVGARNYCYMDAVRRNLGRKRTWICGTLQYLSMYGSAVAYVITTGTSMRAVLMSNCYHKEGRGATCKFDVGLYMMLFGLVQIVVSQIPDIHNIKWLSLIAAIMSFSYSFIGFGLGLAKVIDNGKIQGSISGAPAPSRSKKIFNSFQALADMSYSYPYSMILLEIQDTLKSSPPENQTMKKGSMISISITTFFYLCCGCLGYAAFGNETPGNLLTGFGFYEPYWLVDFANVCIIVHLVGGYQIYSQPIFAYCEKYLIKKFPDSTFMSKFYNINLPFLPNFQLHLLRICFRTVYVLSTTAIALAFPYFNEVLGILGAMTFWPLAVYFPVEMYLVQKEIGTWTKKWIVLRIFSLVCLLISVVGMTGSVEGIVRAKLGN